MLAQQAISKREHQFLMEMKNVRADLQLFNDQGTENSQIGSDIVDQANHTMELAAHGALQRLSMHKLEQLERARDRLLEGIYGICESCSELIDPERLEALPYATLCVGCQQEKERQRRYA